MKSIFWIVSGVERFYFENFVRFTEICEKMLGDVEMQSEGFCTIR